MVGVGHPAPAGALDAEYVLLARLGCGILCFRLSMTGDHAHSELAFLLPLALLDLPPCAALAGYAEFPMQAAWSGMVNVNYAETLPWSRCIGLFSNYDGTSPSNPPKLNQTLVQVGYAVSSREHAGF
jgi:hypothetical protein